MEFETMVTDLSSTGIQESLTAIFHSPNQANTPTILGHEIVGTIVDFGPEADHQDIRWQSLSIGDRVS